jgi:hypothetical protein
LSLLSDTALVAARTRDDNSLRILVVFPPVTGLLSAVMDSITAMLFFAPSHLLGNAGPGVEVALRARDRRRQPEIEAE